MNILDLLKADGITVKKVSGIKGGEYASSCPICGGEDRFHSWPEQGEGGKYWCRQCGIGGDLIQYCRDVRKLSFREACLFLGCEPGPALLSWDRREGAEWTPRDAKPCVGDQWRREAVALVERAEKELWSDAGKSALNWLRHERGFTEETIKAFRLGWMPQTLWKERKAWGLPEIMNDKGKPKRLWIPAGLLIPFFEGESLIKIKIRRSEPDADPRYYLLPGSSTKAMAIDDKRTALIVVESELDAILIHQEAADLCGALALGSASARPDSEITEALKTRSLILVSLDSDEAGAKEAWRWWAEHFHQAKRWPPINGKDPGEMLKAGVSVCAWVKAGIPEIREKQPEAPEPQPETCSRDRETTKSELMKVYEAIGKAYSKEHWKQLIALPGWKPKLDELEQAFTAAWKAGRDCWQELEALKEHWRAGLKAIKEVKAA